MLLLYLGIYICFIVFFIYQDDFLYNPFILLFSNGSLWLPQIVHIYIKNLRNHHPPMSYFLCLTVSQCLSILYLFGCPKNFLQKQTNIIFVIAYLMFVGGQLFILYYQGILGPRFFVPYNMRKDPNAYNYFFKFSRRPRSSTDPEIAAYQEEEHIECVICMNKICYEVDQDGVIIQESVPREQEMTEVSSHNTDSSVEPLESTTFKRAKEFMKTPCGHRYHPKCLRKWMEIRMECPACR